MTGRRRIPWAVEGTISRIVTQEGPIGTPPSGGFPQGVSRLQNEESQNTPVQPSTTGRGTGTPLLVFGVLVAIAAVSLVVLPSLLEEMRDLTPSEPQSRPLPGIGKPLDDLALEPLTGEGKPVTLPGLAGTVAVVNFWGTWCPPCRVEFPDLVKILQEFRHRPDFAVFLVSCSPNSNENVERLRKETQDFLEESKYDVPTYWDPEMRTRRAFHRAATLRGFPTTFVLDQKGVIRGVWPGYDSSVEREIRQLVVQLLGETPHPAEKPGDGNAKGH